MAYYSFYCIMNQRFSPGNFGQHNTRLHILVLESKLFNTHFITNDTLNRLIVMRVFARINMHGIIFAPNSHRGEREGERFG